MRYQVFQISQDEEFFGRPVFLCTGTDFHGLTSTVLVDDVTGVLFEELRQLPWGGQNSLFFDTPLKTEFTTIPEWDVMPGPSYTLRALSGNVVPR